METKNLGKSIAIYICAIISILTTFSGNASAIIAFPLIIIMNVIGYLLVKKKYGKHPELSVLISTNDTLLLYLCKIGGCYAIAFAISFVVANLSGAEDVRPFCFFAFIVLFCMSPSVDGGVKRVQNKYRK